MTIESGASGAGSTEGAAGAGGIRPEDEQPEINLFAMSTIAASQMDHVLKMLMMDSPSLVEPMDPATAGAAAGAMMAKAGASIWDTYLDYLAEEQQRIRDYLRSPKYQQWLEVRSPEMRAKIEIQMDESTPGSTLREKIQNHILNIWTNSLEGMSSYMRNNQKENPGAVAFMAACLVIAGSFLGQPANVVDIASTDMVGAKPIQNAIATNMALFPPTLQEVVALSINLFAMGLIDFSRAEALSGALNSGKPPVTKDIALIFARNTLAKVQGNEVGSFLMAMMVNSTEKGVPLTERKMNQYIAKAKAIMVGIALAALYVVETGRMSPQEFSALVDGKIKSRSDEETRLVAYMQGLRGSGALTNREWNSLISGLGRYFGTLKSADPLFNQGEVFKNLFGSVRDPESRG